MMSVPALTCRDSHLYWYREGNGKWGDCRASHPPSKVSDRRNDAV